MANGNVSPTRVLEGQDARLARALHGIVYDKVHDEIIAPNPFAEAILFFRGGVDGEEAPIRMIQGPHTQIDGGPDWNTPDSVAYDPTYDEVYTRIRRGWGEDATPAILVFPRTGDGDIPPTRVLRGPKTLLNDPYRIGVDGANNILVIANRNPAGFLIFDRDADGDVAPRAIITGPNTGINGAPQQFQMDPERKQFIAAIPGRGSNDERGPTNGFIGVWNYSDDGDVGPKAVIEGSRTLMESPRGLDINIEANEVYLADFKNKLFTYHAPHIFED
jgi:hypothetical protein